MKKITGSIFLVLGIMALAISGMNAKDAPNASYLVGTFMPGLLLLIVGAWLLQEKKK